MEQLYLALAAFTGGISVALAGWAESHEPFNPRKFLASVIRSFVAGVLVAVAYKVPPEGVAVIDLLFAYLSGAGVDALGNRVSGRFLGNGSFPI